MTQPYKKGPPGNFRQGTALRVAANAIRPVYKSL